MKAIEFEGQNTLLNPPKGWDQEVASCGVLPVFAGEMDGLPIIISFWKPSKEDLEKLNAGEYVQLTVVSQVLPALGMQVCDVEELP